MVKYLLIIIPLLLFNSCKEATIEEQYENWYEEAKEKIITASSLDADSISIEVNKIDSTYRIIHSFLNGQKLSSLSYSGDKLRVSYFYSKGGRFKLVREYYTNDFWAFEGIRYDDMFYGPWTVRHSPKDKTPKSLPYKTKAYRFEGKEVGAKIELLLDGEVKETKVLDWVDADLLPEIY